MNKLSVFSIGAVAAATILTGMQVGFADDARDRHAVEAQVQKISDAYRTRDPQLAVSPYSKQNYYLFDAVPPLFDVGYDVVLKKTHAYFDATEGATDLHWTDTNVVVDRHLAYFRGIMHWNATLTGGKKIETQARTTLVFEKQGGQWLITHEHESLPAKDLGL